MIRLNKYIAECGICSRREADRLIERGLVGVNGGLASVGMSIDETKDEVTVNGDVIKAKDHVTVIAYYKPVGVTCSEHDEHADRLILDELDLPERVTYAGRLDRDSEGLIILTNDGDLINSMMRGSKRHEKEYEVNVNKPVTDEFIKKMESGVYLRDLGVKTRPCKLIAKGEKRFNLVLTQGLNRQIRRMCDELGYKVTSLKRIRVMNITLGSLRTGEYRYLNDTEIENLRKAAGGR